MGNIPKSYYPELAIVCKKVREILSKYYKNPIIFEHGSISRSKKGGCCLEHAHFHAVPINIDLFGNLSTKFKSKKITNYLELQKEFANNHPYLYYETNLQEKYLFKLPDIVPSQYIRRLIAYKINKPDE